jgi:hypothetical protein
MQARPRESEKENLSRGSGFAAHTITWFWRVSISNPANVYENTLIIQPARVTFSSTPEKKVVIYKLSFMPTVA